MLISHWLTPKNAHTRKRYGAFSMASCDSASAGTRQKLASTASPSSAEAAAWSAASAEAGGACAAPAQRHMRIEQRSKADVRGMVEFPASFAGQIGQQP
jgi:hypothetical protein